MKFNLKDKRRELVQVLRNEFKIHNSKAWSIMKRVVEQDEEFIDELKEGLCPTRTKDCKDGVCGSRNKIIDKLAGNST